METMLTCISDYAILFNLACVYGELAANDSSHSERHQRNAIAALKRALDLWKKDGSPPHQSIPVLIDREIAGAFRTLRFIPEFNALR